MMKRFSFLREWGWTGLFSLASLEALAALVFLVSLPADAENSIFLGFSLRRLALMGALLFLLAGCAVLAWQTRQPAWRLRWLNPVSRWRQFNALMLALPLGLLISLLTPVLLLSIYRTGGDFRYLAFYQRLLPLFAWIFLFCLQGSLWLAWTGDFQWHALRYLRGSFQSGLVFFAAFALAWLVIWLTGIGLKPDVVGWGDPSVPILEWQVWFSWLAGCLFLFYLLNRQWPARRDWFIAAAIWLLAAGIWLSQPVQTAYFATAGRAPNYEIYPFSDGAYYGQFAQNVLIGNGFRGDEVPPRPLYIVLLAGFHALAGQGYENVIVLQTLMLAFFPVILYFIGRELHSRPAGLVIALLAILRELTAILTVGITNKASTSQLFFSDLPSALAISLWGLATVVWLKAPGRSPFGPLLVGGAMGLAMLFRTQSVFMLPLTLLLALFVLRGRWSVWLGQVGLVLLGLGLVLAPWLWRNWQVTGQLAFDDPKTQTGVMAQRYSLSEDSASGEFILQPGENTQAYSERINQGLIGFMLEHPAVVAGFVSAHFINAEIDNLLILPVRDGVSAPQELLMPTHPFWESWSGSPSPAQALLIAFNLGLIALGIGSAWTRRRWAGLALVLMNFAYNGSNALARNSGWRYLLPVDWMVLVYIGIALMELAVAIFLILGISPGILAAHLTSTGEISNWAGYRGKRLGWGVVGLCLGLLLSGSVVPLAERIAPQRYPSQTREELSAEFMRNPLLDNAGIEADHWEKLLMDPDAQLFKGRALYPRFYAAGEGEPRTAKAGYEPLDYARMLFLTASFSYNGLVMLRSDQSPPYLPNTADVIVLGCAAGTYLDAQAVLVLGSPGGLYLSDDWLPEGCETAPGTIP